MNTKSVRWAFNFTKWNPSRSDMLLASSCIQAEEKERLCKFVFKKDLKSSLIGRLMMRKYVSEATEKKYNEIHLIRKDNGKPVADDLNVALSFNVSHQGDYTVCAGESGDIILGVDVMQLAYKGGNTLSEFFRLMTRQFSAHEWVTIKGAGNNKEQIAMFCRHWCLKESYVKAIEVGITINLQEISFKVNTKNLSEDRIINDTELYVKGEKINWQFQEMLLDSQHCVAVAMNTWDRGEIIFKEIHFDDLMRNCVPLMQADEQFCDNYFSKLDKV